MALSAFPLQHPRSCGRAIEQFDHHKDDKCNDGEVDGRLNQGSVADLGCRLAFPQGDRVLGEIRSPLNQTDNGCDHILDHR